MKILYLFLIYKNPQIVAHTINRLQHPDALFYIHVDKNSNCDFSLLNNSANVYWASERFPTEWGTANIPLAIESCLRDIIKNIRTDYVILMSESDYPVKPAHYIHKILASAHQDFVTSSKLPNNNPLHTKGSFWLEGGRRRLECYPVRLNNRSIATIEPRKFNWGNFRQFGKICIQHPAALPHALYIWWRAPKRKHPDYLSPYGGELWFILRTKTIQKILNFIDKHPDYKAYCINTPVLDELYIPTLVHAVVPEEEIVNENMRYINWGERGDSPVELTISDKDTILEQIGKSNKLFARKIQDMEVCQLIDEHLHHLEHHMPDSL